ncbi:hypothetical protein [Mucilaginibacter sp. OK098]|uniref:hypothetical protein n=1 Tax=Mucilaginibacter sp. OK098 TaxID=1855297 RepID=UPI0009342F50|nr:hypothetical protein [Mucilaginibacter sp. OK098]
MTTITLEIPESATDDISNLVKAKGGNILSIHNDDEDLSENEVELLKRGLKEALSIKEGKVKSIPFSELWND